MVIWEGERTHFLHLGCLERECALLMHALASMMRLAQLLLGAWEQRRSLNGYSLGRLMQNV